MKRRMLMLLLLSLIVAASGRSSETYAQDHDSSRRAAAVSAKPSDKLKSSCENGRVISERTTSFDLSRIDGEVTKEFYKA